MNENFSHTKAEQTLEHNIISLTDMLLIIAQQIKIIIIVPTIICIITIIYVSFFIEPIFTSTSKIMFSSNAGGVSQVAGIASQFGINIPTGNQTEQKWAYAEIIKSRTLSKKMLNKKFDTKKFGSQKSLLQILTYGNQTPSIGLDTLEIFAVDKLLSMIDLSEDKITGIYTLTISASEPHFSAELNKLLIEEVDAFQREYNKSKTSETKNFIIERILTTEKELKIAEEELKNFSDRNRRIENSPALLLDQQRLAREVTVLTGVFTTLKQQFETTKIEELREADYVIVLDPPEIPLYSSKPKKKKMVILAGIIGIALGIAIGFIIEFFKNKNNYDREKINRAFILFQKNIIDFIPGFSKD